MVITPEECTEWLREEKTKHFEGDEEHDRPNPRSQTNPGAGNVKISFGLTFVVTGCICPILNFAAYIAEQCLVVSIHDNGSDRKTECLRLNAYD